MTIRSSLLDKEVNRISCALIKLAVWQNFVSILLVIPIGMVFSRIAASSKGNQCSAITLSNIETSDQLH